MYSSCQEVSCGLFRLSVKLYPDELIKTIFSGKHPSIGGNGPLLHLFPEAEPFLSTQPGSNYYSTKALETVPKVL